jgi:hypothetical protein
MSNNYTIKVSTQNPFIEEYNEKDLKLIPSFDSISEFRPSIDKVEFSIYNEQGVLEYINYNYTNYSVTSGFNSSTGAVTEINADPGRDLVNEGFEQGVYNVVYNFLREKVNTSQTNPLFIQQISSDRTELRLASNTLSNDEIEGATNSFITELNGSPFFEDFYLNFGNNNLALSINIALDDSDEEQYTIIVKLYEPLPTQFELKDTCWIVLQTAEVISFDVEFSPQVIQLEPPVFIKGPNLDLKIKDEVNNSNIYQNLNGLTSTILTSSKNDLENILNEKGIKIDVNYEDFNDFVYFSSAQTRLENFYYKVKQITGYQEEIDGIKADITGSTSGSFAVASSLQILENSITNIIKNFDGYDRFLYYTSGSDWTWPKTTSTAPYTLAPTGSSLIQNWYGNVESLEVNAQGIIGSASLYDQDNDDRLKNTLPDFVKDDLTNTPFFLFMDMVGQHFDVFWTYTKAIGDRYDADNRLNKGISKDLVADAIRSMGVSLYQNNFSTDDLYSAFVGINASGSLLPPTGSEKIDTYITASSDIIKLDDVNKETYKRIFHNLPFLLKTKGTVTGLRALINTYGIPDTILRISEFGGKDKDNSNDWDYYQNKFNYAVTSSGFTTSDSINVPFATNEDWGGVPSFYRPSGVFFRFKINEDLPTEDKYTLLVDSTPLQNLNITLDYTGSAYLSGSYSGSIPSASNEYAKLTFWEGNNDYLSVSAPFYNGNWWSVYFGRNQGGGTPTVDTHYLEAAESIYDGGDGYKIGIHTSSSGNFQSAQWFTTTNLSWGLANNTARTLGSNDYYGFTGSFQEIRYYNSGSSPSTFFPDYVMNPYSIEGLNYSSSADNIIFRAPLGSNLNTSTGTLVSTHPKVTGSYTTSSFASNSNYTIGSSAKFQPNTEFIYYDQPAVGMKNRVSEKVRTVDNVVPSGDTLTPYRTIQQRYPQSESYTRDVNHVEVAFSPQNEINDDINSSFGYFNIGEYIGDPRQVSESFNTYPDLDQLRDNYFEKYYKAYDWRDYVRLIKYFDNSLFKMIKDFVPAKSSVTTGVVIKQHLLERNKQRPPVVSYTNPQYSGSIYSGSVIGTADGGAGGVFNYVNVSGSAITASVSPQVTQSWTYGVSGPAGTFILTQSSQDEYYNGELSGSNPTATDGELLPNNPYKSPLTTQNSYKIKVFRGDGSDNRGQTTDRIITETDMLYDQDTLWSQIPGVLRTCVRDIPEENVSYTGAPKGHYLDSGPLVSYQNTLGFDTNQRYLILAQYSGSNTSEGYNEYIVSSSLSYSDIDTMFVDPAVYTSYYNGSDPQYAFFSKIKPNFYIKLQAQLDPERYLVFHFTSQSFFDYDANGYDVDNNPYSGNMISFNSGSIVKSKGILGQGELVSMYIDNPQVQNNGILIRDFLSSTYSVPEGYLYLFYDTGSNLE